MRWFKQSSNNSSFDWKPLTSEEQFLELLEEEQTLAVFKHSTRCSISFMAKSRVERGWRDTDVPLYCLDLITYRNVSDLIARTLNIDHQSPQLIFIEKGKAIYNASHNAISPQAALSAVSVGN